MNREGLQTRRLLCFFRYSNVIELSDTMHIHASKFVNFMGLLYYKILTQNNTGHNARVTRRIYKSLTFSAKRLVVKVNFIWVNNHICSLPHTDSCCID